MKLSDVLHGSDYMIWVIFAIFAVLSAVLISGHGSGLIAGFNTMSEEKKAKYDEKKLCRVFGFGLSVISLLILITGLFKNVLPAGFSYITLALIVTDCAAMIVIGNTKCKKP